MVDEAEEDPSSDETVGVGVDHADCDARHEAVEVHQNPRVPDDVHDEHAVVAAAAAVRIPCCRQRRRPRDDGEPRAGRPHALPQLQPSDERVRPPRRHVVAPMWDRKRSWEEEAFLLQHAAVVVVEEEDDANNAHDDAATDNDAAAAAEVRVRTCTRPKRLSNQCYSFSCAWHCLLEPLFWQSFLVCLPRL